jgi:capsular exopolysaccharide synthesis family protein
MAMSLTRMIASSGHKVILIEADLRRPSQHKQLGIERNIGLAEVLIGSATLEDAIYQDPKTSAAILLAGKETINPSKLLSSHQMTDLVKRLAQEYDIVIIDSAPVLAVSDGLLLSNRADGTIYCCRWASTTRETAALGLKVLQEAGARIVGASITVVDQSKSRSYGYADTSYYYYAKRYYSE